MVYSKDQYWVMFFTINNSDWNKKVGSMINMFAGNINVYGIGESDEGCQRLQLDIDQLRKGKGMLMDFNSDKCKVTHFARVLYSVVEQRDLGEQVQSSLKRVTIVDTEVKKAHSTLVFISTSIDYKSWKIMLQLYKRLVRPLGALCAILIVSVQ